MDYGCKLVTIVLYVTWLVLFTFAEALSFSLIKLLYYVCMCVCICPVFPTLLLFQFINNSGFSNCLVRINPSPFI